jgi:hypothetical protein
MLRKRSRRKPRVVHLFMAALAAARCKTTTHVIDATIDEKLVTCRQCLALMRTPASIGEKENLR